MTKTIQQFWILIMSALASPAAISETWPNYNPEKKVFKNIEVDIPLQASFLDMVAASYQILCNGKSRAPTVPLPEIKPDLVAFETRNEGFQFIWFGHSTLLWKMDETVILVDPVFSNNASPTGFITKRFQAPVLALEGLPKVDAIIISHDHYDHLDEATVRFFSQHDTKFIVPLKFGELLKEWGVGEANIIELNWNEHYTLNSVRFTATTAHHQSGRGLFDQGKTLWASWVVKGKNQSIFYSGDTAYKGHFKAIGEEHGPFDIAFIENGQYDVKWPDAHMQPEQSVQAAIDLGAQVFVPVHWGMFDLSLHHWAEPVQRSSKIAQERGIRFLSPRLGQLIADDNLPEYDPWWEAVLKEEEALRSSHLLSL